MTEQRFFKKPKNLKSTMYFSIIDLLKVVSNGKQNFIYVHNDFYVTDKSVISNRHPNKKLKGPVCMKIKE